MAQRLWELARLFLKLGAIGFGGPAVHIAVMEEETVRRRRWLTHDEFLDMIGATQLIPGPNSTEIAMHVGYRRAGYTGLIVAGACFILPAVAITAVFAYVYVQLQRLPTEQIAPILNGIKPAVLAIIFAALWRLAAKAIKTQTLGWLAAAAAVFALLLPGREVWVLLTASVVGMTLLSLQQTQPAKPTKPNSRPKRRKSRRNSILPSLVGFAGAAGAATSTTVAGASLWQLGLFFLKVGAVLYGSGYVLIAYLRGGLVEEFGWLTEAQLVDAVAVGQFTPGPILSTATFIGFVVMCPEPGGNVFAGLQGAALASFAIFLPSFVFVALLGPLVPKLRKNIWAGRFLDAINAASIGLMAAVTFALSFDILFIHDENVDELTGVRWSSVIIAGIAGSLLLRWKLSPAWLVLGGAIAGWVVGLIS